MTVMMPGPGTGDYFNSLEAQQLRQDMGTTGVFGQASATDTMVYLGDNYNLTKGVPSFLQKPGASNGMFTIDEAKALYTQMDKKEVQRFDNAIEKLTGRRPTGLSNQDYWEQMIGQAGVYSNATGKPISPWEIAELLAARTPAAEGGGAYTGPTTTTYKDENVNLTNPSNARALIDNAIGGYLGRKPSSKEYKTFLQALNATEEASPTISERVTKSSGAGNPASQTVSTKGKSMGGVSTQQFANEFAKSDEQYAETQLSTTGLQSFLSMLG
jgi:hypothetical protein